MKEEAPAAPPQTDGCTGRWLCDTAEEAVANAKAAQEQLAEMTLEKRGELIAAMRKAGIDNAEYLARLAHEETGYGRVADKVQKNLLVSTSVSGFFMGEPREVFGVCLLYTSEQPSSMPSPT